jgi:hypothetical protein
MIIGRPSVVCAALAVAWLLCVGVGSSIAAPTVSSVSGTVANGQSITITGSNFGVGPNVLLFDDFEGGSNGSQIATGSGSAKVGEWAGLNGSGSGMPSYSTGQKVSGNMAAHMSNANKIWYNELVASIPAQNQVFLSWWMWIDTVPANTSSAANWKTVWIMNSGTTDYDFTLPTFFGSGNNGMYGSNYLGDNCGGYGDWSVPTLSTGTWLRTWVFLDGSSDGKYLQSWSLSNSGVVQSATSSNSASSCWFNGAESFAQVYFNGYMGVYNSTVSNAYFDDIYIAYGPNAMARVEIGNASTYNACTNLTMVTPTSWGASSIAATVRQGSFGSSASAYLYVVDATGTPNANGYPVTFGGGSSTPAIPGGLHLE